MNKSFPSTNYLTFLKTDTAKYTGEWIAIAGKKVVAHGKNADTVYKSALKKVPSQHISLAKAPDQQMLVLKTS